MHSSSRILLCLMILKTVIPADSFSNPSRKSWWTKRVASDSFHTAGRLTVRQIKYASEAGFRTIISLFEYDSQAGDSSAEGGNYFPTTAEARYTAENLAGVQYATVLDITESDGWRNVDTVRKFQDVVKTSPKPILFHCTHSYAATFVLLSYFANATTQGTNGAHEPTVTAADVFQIGSGHGFDFAQDTRLSSIISELSGSSVSDPHRPSTLSSNWYHHYWLMKPVYKNWFISGQIQEDHLSQLKSAGIEVILNSRKGMTVPPDTPSQEEVTLLNIKDRTGTYADGGRQTTAALEANRLDPLKSVEYISNSAQINYETRNPWEFGDDIGYNEQTERAAVLANLAESYYNLPIGGQYGYNVDMWNAYKEKLEEADGAGMVLLHCRTGFRSGVIGILGAAYLNCFSSDWAIERAREVGYVYDVTVQGLFQSVLDGRADLTECIRHRDGLQTVAPTDSSATNIQGVTACLTIAWVLLATSLLEVT